MRRRPDARWPIWVALALLAVAPSSSRAGSPSNSPSNSPAGSGPPAGSSPIAAHPRDLDFPPLPFELPTADPYLGSIAGAPALLVADPSLPLVEITVVLPRGSGLDPVSRPGLGEITAAALRRAGAGERTPEAFDQRADELGAELDAYGLVTRSAARLSIPSWNLEAGLDLLFDLLSRPRFSAGGLDPLLANLREGMGRRNQRATALLDTEWAELLYTPGERSPPLTPASLDGLGAEELRRHHRRVWRPDGAVWALAGAFDAEPLTVELERRVASWNAEVTGPPPSETEAPREAPAAPERDDRVSPGLYHLEAALPQTLVALGHRLEEAPGWLDPERSHLALTAEILGGSGAISRLAGRLRSAEGLVYAAGARLDPGDRQPGSLRIDLSTEPGQVPDALRLTLEEMTRLRSTPPEEWEVEAARQNLLAELMLDWDTPSEVAGRFAEDVLLGRPHEHAHRDRDTLLATTPKTIRQVARRRIDPDRLIVLVVGPWAQISGGAPPGRSALERIAGHTVVHLPPRDPRTLRPLP